MMRVRIVLETNPGLKRQKLTTIFHKENDRMMRKNIYQLFVILTVSVLLVTNTVSYALSQTTNFKAVSSEVPNGPPIPTLVLISAFHIQPIGLSYHAKIVMAWEVL